MSRNTLTRKLATCLATLALVLGFAASAAAQPLAPRNNVTYTCGPGSAIVFHVNGSATFKRGTCDIKKSGSWDTKKCDLAWQNNSNFWEFTQVGEGQCQNTIVFRDYQTRREYVLFQSCSGALSNATCWAYF